MINGGGREAATSVVDTTKEGMHETDSDVGRTIADMSSHTHVVRRRCGDSRRNRHKTPRA